MMLLPANVPVSGSAAAGDGASRTSTSARRLLLVFMLFVVMVSLSGIAVFNRYKDSIKSSSQEDLAGFAELKIRQIENWMDERRGDAQILTGDPLFFAEVGRWLQTGDAAGRAKVLAYLNWLQQANVEQHYESISLFDERGSLRLSTSAAAEPLGKREKQRLLGSMHEGRIVFSDIHSEKLDSGERVEIELWAPLLQTVQGKSHAIGAVLFRIDPYRFLFPLIQRWPTSSPSAETLLVRRDGDEVVFLNVLRHNSNTPLSLRFPLSRKELPAVQAVMGTEGMVEGRDYRGMSVVGVVNRVPGTSWFMVSKIDKSEIYAPINHLARWVAALQLILVCASGALAVYWLREVKRQHSKELERQALARHLDYLAKYANDIILLIDSGGGIVDCNDRAVEAFGYPVTALLCLNVEDLRVPGESMAPGDRFKQVDWAGGSLLFESAMQHRDGRRFPVEVSMRRIDAGGERYYQAIVRNISERRKAEEELRFHSLILQSLLEGILLTRAADGIIVYATPQFEHMFGYSSGELTGKHVSVINAAGERSPQQVADEINGELARGGKWSGEVRNVRKDGTVFWCHVRVSAFEHPQYGKVWVSLQEDISERKRRDQELAERSMHIRLLSHQLGNLKEDEMRRLSGELHDRCSPNLSALKIYCQLLSDALPAQVAGENSDILKNISALLSDTTESIREVCAELRPAVLDYAGLWPALENLVQRFTERTGINVELAQDMSGMRFERDVETRLFRLVQEALTNCAKHAHAKNVRIAFARRGTSAILTIFDDGIGFDPATLGRNGQVGLGLLTMREGVESVGGRFSIDASNGKGTCITVELPETAFSHRMQ